MKSPPFVIRQKGEIVAKDRVVNTISFSSAALRYNSNLVSPQIFTKYDRNRISL